MELGRIGIWSSRLRTIDPSEAVEAVAELESLGFGTVWMPGRTATEYFQVAGRLLDGTSTVAIAPGILSTYTTPAGEAALAHAAFQAAHPGRFLLGLGVSHPQHVEAQTGQSYGPPLATMRTYLDELDATRPLVAREQRILAALGPRMLKLAGQRSLGAHPYLVDPSHTRFAREVLGAGPILAPEQAVVLETDPDQARTIARTHLERYLGMAAYAANFLRLGYTRDDLTDGGSDRLVDGIVAWGDESAIARRITEHRDAGADHVCIQVLGSDLNELPREQWRRLAPALA